MRDTACWSDSTTSDRRSDQAISQQNEDRVRAGFEWHVVTLEGGKIGRVWAYLDRAETLGLEE